MFTLDKILAPVDFSERSIGAIRYAEAVAEHLGSRVVLLHVLPPPHYEFSSLEVGGTVLNELFESRAAHVREELDGFVVEELPRLNAARVLLEGDPARKIIEYAHDEGSQLIVIPTHGYGPFRRFILGSVTAKILHDADCPVLTGVHLEKAPDVDKIQFRTIAVAVDLGPESERSLSWAAEFAASWQARLVLIHATPAIESRSGEYFDTEWREHLSKEVTAEIDGMQQKLSTSAEVVVENGDAPEVVCNAAKQFQADLLVIGRGSAAGVFGRLRTNAYSIIRQSPCPVVSV